MAPRSICRSTPRPPSDAKTVAEEVVAAALTSHNLDGGARALQVYDADGNFIE
jgi:hypothetical protein